MVKNHVPSHTIELGVKEVYRLKKRSGRPRSHSRSSIPAPNASGATTAGALARG